MSEETKKIELGREGLYDARTVSYTHLDVYKRQGLIKAVNSFDNTKGARFATYAARCIENAILPQMRRETRREYKRARSWRLKQKTAPEECSSGAVFMCFAQFRALR